MFSVYIVFGYFATMAFFVDQLGRSVELLNSPKRIVSLVPSQTELLFDLGLNDKVIGITKFCVHPADWYRTKKRIGGTKQLHIDEIKELTPDLIIANKEENVREQIEELAKDFPVWISDVNNLHSALSMIRGIGQITSREPQAEGIMHEIQLRFSQLPMTNLKLKTSYLIWKDPFMTVGGDTFINDMLKYAGFQNVFENQKRYPELKFDDFKTANCDLILLSSEPYPFKQIHTSELQSFLPGTNIILVDGEMFSWYGSRLLKAPAYFRQLQNQILSLKHARGS
jgi:ABC-type Fe3+-hydroxamate transport system substrate-binding protein